MEGNKEEFKKILTTTLAFGGKKGSAKSASTPASKTASNLPKSDKVTELINKIKTLDTTSLSNFKIGLQKLVTKKGDTKKVIDKIVKIVQPNKSSNDLNQQQTDIVNILNFEKNPISTSAAIRDDGVSELLTSKINEAYNNELKLA